MFSCVASFPTPSAFLVAPSYTTSPVLEKTLSFDTLICPLYTYSHSPFVYFVCALMLFFCVASFPTPSAFLVAPSYTTSPVLLGKVLDPSFKEEETRLFLRVKVLDPSRLCRELHKKRQDKCRILNSVLPAHELQLNAHQISFVDDVRKIVRSHKKLIIQTHFCSSNKDRKG
jgi:hypothetical protein